MIFTQPLSFINEFVEELDQGIRDCAPHRKLSTIQRYWLSFCLIGILLSNPVCWAAFERVGLGGGGFTAHVAAPDTHATAFPASG